MQIKEKLIELRKQLPHGSIKIISDKKVRVDTMMLEEHNMILEDKEPRKTALATFLSFIGIGFIPLISYALFYIFPLKFQILFSGDSPFLNFYFLQIMFEICLYFHTFSIILLRNLCICNCK